VKQILLQLDESGHLGRFIIADLDDTHLLIANDYVERVQDVCFSLLSITLNKLIENRGNKQELELELEKNHFAQGGDEE